MNLALTLRRRFRPSLRALMGVVLLVGVGLGWVVHRARVQRQAVAAIERAGGQVLYDWEWKDFRSTPDGTPRGPRWLVGLLGVDSIADVTGVAYHGLGADEVASQVARLGRVESIVFNGSDLTDAGLKRLDGSRLQMLYLAGVTGITDAGLAHLEGMPRLERVDLMSTNVGDAGLAHLVRLPRLRWLHLGKTRITDAGLVHVERMRGLSTLYLYETKISDAGLARLNALDSLRVLTLHGTAVSDNGVRSLRSALPKATITP